MCIRDSSGTLISDIERHYKEICKERGIDPNAKKEPEMAAVSYTHLGNPQLVELAKSQVGNGRTTLLELVRL